MIFQNPIPYFYMSSLLFIEINFRYFRILLANFHFFKFSDDSYFIFSISNPWEVKAMKGLLDALHIYSLEMGIASNIPDTIWL